MWHELWENHRGKSIGIAAGFILGIIYLIVGFWKMVFFLLLMLIGYYIGSKVDRGEWGTLIARIVNWLQQRWNPFK